MRFRASPLPPTVIIGLPQPLTASSEPFQHNMEIMFVCVSSLGILSEGGVAVDPYLSSRTS